MGGGGGGYFRPRTDPEKLKQKLRDSEARTIDARYEAEIAGFLASLLTKFNDRNNDAINRHLAEIKKALEKELEGTLDLLFGGSVAKHTYVDGLSDIDSLVIINSCELSNQPPDILKKYFAQRIRERFPKSEVEVGKLAVTVRFVDAEIQLLPAVSCKNHVKIVDKTGREWSLINPEKFSSVFTKINQQIGRKVVPAVKLAKAIISNLPEKHQVSGYHAESLAVEIFKNYSGGLKPKSMLKYYFQEASKKVLQPIRDRTGQSVHVDDYLGAPNSLERRIVSDAFARVYRRIKNADNASSLDDWKTLFGT
jgi:predicted nucleotidyltransferase